MAYWVLCLSVFALTYLINIFYISVLYHRGLTHSAVTLGSAARRFVASTGNWITGMDPLAWCCMHRMHHRYSDTPLDPHSPVTRGVWPVFMAQLDSYKSTLKGLLKGEDFYVSQVRDLDFPVSWLNRKKRWALPYLLHAGIGLVLAIGFRVPLLGLSYWLGMMSHPIQGWMVNALAHSWGHRNFSTPDNSRNNTLVAWLVMGEGFQNNHHFSPASARFSYQRWEVDLGYVLCLIAEKAGVLQVRRDLLLATQVSRESAIVGT